MFVFCVLQIYARARVCVSWGREGGPGPLGSPLAGSAGLKFKIMIQVWVPNSKEGSKSGFKLRIGGTPSSTNPDTINDAIKRLDLADTATEPIFNYDLMRVGEEMNIIPTSTHCRTHMPRLPKG